MYECDVNAGLFRKFNSTIYNQSNPAHNTWQIEGMPIKASYCDAWFQACKNDMFCGNGDFFSCAATYEMEDAAAKAAQALAAEAQAEARNAKGNAQLWTGVGIIGIALLGAIFLFLFYVIKREREKKPLFMPFMELDEGGSAQVEQSQL